MPFITRDPVKSMWNPSFADCPNRMRILKSVHKRVFLTHKQNITSQVQKSEMLLEENSQHQKDGEFNPPCPPKP